MMPEKEGEKILGAAMKKIMMILVVMLGFSSPAWGLEEVTPSEVFGQIVQVDKEVALLKRHFGITE